MDIDVNDIKDEKLKSVCTNFSRLNNEQQEYILGILQALVYANTTEKSDDSADASK